MGAEAVPAAAPKLVSALGLTVTVGTVTVNGVAEVAVPPEVVAAMGPVVAPPGTVATSVVALLIVTLAAATPLKVTAELPVK